VGIYGVPVWGVESAKGQVQMDIVIVTDLRWSETALTYAHALIVKISVNSLNNIKKSFIIYLLFIYITGKPAPLLHLLAFTIIQQ
jgi:hypothetical protein